MKQTDTAKQSPAALGAEESADVVSYIKVRAIRKTEPEPVYNLEVPDTHCFAVNGGLIVHNCMDAARYLCKTLITRRRLAFVKEDIT